MGVGWRLLMLSAMAAMSIAVMVPQASAQESQLIPPSASHHSPIKLKLEDFTNPHPQGIVLPLGMDYSHETKSLVMPLDDERRWGVGVNLDIGDAKDFNATSGLGVELKNTPGVVLQHSF